MISDERLSKGSNFHPPGLEAELAEKGLRVHPFHADTAIYLSRRLPFDFLALGEFHIRDMEGENWKFFEPDLYGIDDPAIIEAGWSRIAEAYETMDRCVGTLRRIHPDAITIIVSDHGMKAALPPKYSINFRTLFMALGVPAEDYHFLLEEGENRKSFSMRVDHFDREGIEKRFETVRSRKDGTRLFREARFVDEKRFELTFELDNQNLVFRPADFRHFLPLRVGQQDFDLIAYEQSGFHEAPCPGIFFVVGHGIRPNHRIDHVAMYDITPTILYLAGVPVPKDMEGRVLTEIIDEDYLKSHPVRYTDTSSQKEDITGEGDGKGDQEILDKLGTLGYT